MNTLKDFRNGDRIELQPHLDLWMQGARFGSVVSVGRKKVSVKLDRLSLVQRIAPEDLTHA